MVIFGVKNKTMRTNIEIDDNLLAQAMEMSGAKTKKELVNQALKDLVYKLALKRLRDMRGKGWDGDLDQMRGL